MYGLFNENVDPINHPSAYLIFFTLNQSLNSRLEQILQILELFSFQSVFYLLKEKRKRAEFSALLGQNSKFPTPSFCCLLKKFRPAIFQGVYQDDSFLVSSRFFQDLTQQCRKLVVRKLSKPSLPQASALS